MDVDVQAIPQSLRQRSQWCCWKYVHRDGEPKPTKVPINAKTGSNASSTNPETWSSFRTALNRLQTGGVDGIGYVFADDHIGVDLDGAIDDSGGIKPWADRIVKELATYTEKSPSRTGLHLICAGSLPEGWKGTKRVYKDGAVEIYSRARFFTMTGDSIGGRFAGLHDYSPIVQELYRRIGGNIPGNGIGCTPSDNGHLHHHVLHDDDQRLEVALGDPVFARLWHGDTSRNHDDDSAADLALCNKLVFYFGPDHDVVDRLFRRSRLYRDKWERADYRKLTIDKAIEGATESYSGKFAVRTSGERKSGIEPGTISRSEPREDKFDDDQPKPSATLKNAVRAILENHLADPHYDEFLCRIVTGNPGREWTDDDDLELTITLQSLRGFGRIGLETVRNAALVIASRNRKNSVKDWLESLQWDGEPRIAHFFEDAFGAAGTVYTRAASKNFLISMVARIYKPGCQSDHMVVLEGSQGIGKSSALRIIGGDWFTEQHESATGKGFFEVLQGKWLVEISEMDSFDRVEVTKVKQIVTCTNDRFRESYGRHAKDHPRQCIFVGTTNRDDWNRDETGARRFWPIACNGDIDLAGIRMNRDQLFAEAAHRFKSGESWWEMPTEETKAEQESRYSPDPWMEVIHEFILPKSKVTTNEVLIDCLGCEKSRIGKRDQMRVAACLRGLKWKKGKSERVLGNPTPIWRPHE